MAPRLEVAVADAAVLLTAVLVLAEEAAEDEADDADEPVLAVEPDEVEPEPAATRDFPPPLP